MSFSEALLHLKRGRKVSRSGWNGKGMYIFLIGNNGLKEEGVVTYWTYTNGVNDNHPLGEFIAIKGADNIVLPWVTSQQDVLAEDWSVL